MLRRIGPRLAAVVTGVLLLVTTAPGAQASAQPDPTAPGKHKVAVADYNLGDSAFRIPGFTTFGSDKPAPLELAGRVHYPSDLNNGPYPLVLLAHGLWSTCADRAASDEFDAANKILYGPNPPEDPEELARLEAISERTGELLNRWPCAPGTPGLPSLRGYDYLGQQLASHGFVVVSIGVNGVNVGEMGEIQDEARAPWPTSTCRCGGTWWPRARARWPVTSPGPTLPFVGEWTCSGSGWWATHAAVAG